MATATADPLVGRSLDGRYRILERIARGGMSTVYAAVDERLDRLVAVKVMSPTLSADPAFADRFTREARAAARLAHVNTVSVYDQGADHSDGTNQVFLVMELVEGRTLRDLIRERGRFTPAEAVSIMEPVLAALAAAHRAGLVHRDIKPENILLSDDGLVKVADFGLARAVEADAASTRTGLMMGTVAYCAPEQISRGQADQRSDVYSAGVVMFELLTGRPPYHGESAMNVAYQHVHSRVPAPSSRVSGIPMEVDELVVSATDSDPGGRPADAPTFLAELADLRTTLRLPIVAIPRRPRPPLGTGGPSRGGLTGRTDRTVLTGPRRVAAAAPTDALRGRRPVRHDTALVSGGRSGPLAAQAPAPPVGRRPPPLPPPLAPPGPAGRRPPPHGKWSGRRRLVTLVIVLLIGLAAALTGWYGTRYYQRWNSHVPVIKHISLDSARSQLLSAHYRTGNVTSQFSDTVPKGDVISTSPKAGARLQQGKKVDLVISLGRDLVIVPNVAKDPVAAAETALQGGNLRFDPAVTRTASLTVPRGQVIRTQPAAGKHVPRNATVTLIVSTGLPIVSIPTITVGTSYQSVQQILTQAHFAVHEVMKYNRTISAGDVITSTPTGTARRGSTITVTVSKGPHYVTVPFIKKGTPYTDAVQMLAGAGLQAHEVLVYGGTLGLVVAESPHAGEQVIIGSTITLYVA